MTILSHQVTLGRVDYTALVLDAASWRMLCRSSYIAEILAEWAEWDLRRRHREASHAVAAGAKEWADQGWAWLSYAELDKRRELTSAIPCTDCGSPVEMVHPFLDPNWNIPLVRCDGCGPKGGGA